MKNYTEFCNQQAEKLFHIIDTHDGLLEWKKTWDVQGSLCLPKSIHGHYQGVNLWSLLVAQIERGLVSESWLTFNQIKQKGGHVFKGAKGQQVCFFKINEVEEDEKNRTDKQLLLPIFRQYTVFNLDQTSLAGQGILEVRTPKKLQMLVDQLGVHVSEFGNRAYFNPAEDCIVMPKREFFNCSEDYDATLLHEIVHWTGLTTRLNRACTNDYSKSYVARAEEELVAEIGSIFLTAHFGISGNLINHASYVASWKKLLNAKVVGRAISQASKAFQWLVSRIAEKNQANAA